MRLDDTPIDLNSARPAPGRTYAMVSTYPPTPCGVATFAAALGGGLTSTGAEVEVIRVDGPGPAGDHPVVGHLDADGAPSASAAQALERADAVILQHEYGIFAGRDGASVVDLLAPITQPLIVVAHTVVSNPTPSQRSVLEAVADAADVVVVMTEAGRLRLGSRFDVDPDKVVVIPHGAAVAPAGASAPARPRGALTWGLLGPGKGIEWAIDALALLRDIHPAITYRIAGDTHPKVAAKEGEAYREMLRRRAATAGIAASVQFDAGYRSVAQLSELIRASEVVVLPYDSLDQVTSGVLVDAVAAGRPVVSTAFPHAVELLASGAGLVVPRRDPEALAGALRRVLTEPGLAAAMGAEARRIAPSLAWPAVAQRYADLGERVVDQRSAVVA